MGVYYEKLEIRLGMTLAMLMGAASLAAMVLFGLGLAVTTVGLTVYALAVIQVSYRKKQHSSPQR